MLLLAAVGVFLEANLGTHVDGVFQVRISGRIVDAAAGEPVQGVWVVPMRNLRGSTAWGSVEARKKALEIANETGYPLRGGARSAGDGSFSFLFPVGWSWGEGFLGFGRGKTTPPPFYSVEGLLLAKPGHEDVVAETRGAVWNADPQEEGTFASIEMGDVRFGD